MAMSIPDNTILPGVERLKLLIRDLLRTVRDEHGVVTIEPQLKQQHFDVNISKLPELCPYHDFKVLLECACKSILYEIAIEPQSDERFSSFCNLLDLALVLTEIGHADVTLPFVLIEELFDSQTIDSCQQLFEYLESRVERLTADMDGAKGKGPVLLRLCNELLRRLSKAEDTIFCGRILIFLSKSFILGERSGVNLRGEFNVENTTSFDEIPAASNNEEMEIDKQEGGVKAQGEEAADDHGEAEAKFADDTTKAGKTVTFETNSQQQKKDQEVLSADALYPVFWSLQGYFSNPTRLFVKDAFETFKLGLASTMAKFKAVDEEQSKQGTANRTADDGKGRGATGGGMAGEKRKRGSDEDMAAHFNPKYLTSRELFELELSDLTFRRHVLVQALILIDFLLSLTPAAKERWADITSPNKAVQFSFTLSADDEKWANKTRSLISEYLHPNFEGRLFMRLVETILTRDKNWVQWKAENCLSFEKKPVPEEEVKQCMDRAMEFCRPTKPYPHAMGAPALGRLWMESSKNPGLEGLKRKERYTLPTLESFRPLIRQDEEEIADALRPDQAEAAASAKASKVWRALRIASRDRLHVFNKFADTPDEDRNELEMIYKIEEDEQNAKRQKLEDAAAAAAAAAGNGIARDKPTVLGSASQSAHLATGSAGSAMERRPTTSNTSPPSPHSQYLQATPSTGGTPVVSAVDSGRGDVSMEDAPLSDSSPSVSTSAIPTPQRSDSNNNGDGGPTGSSTQPGMKLHRIENAVTS